MSEQNVCLNQFSAGGDIRHAVLALSGFARPQNIMPMELHVFLQSAALPTRVEWQAGIIDHGFPLTLDKVLDIRHHTGFSPVVCWGKKSGFEFDLHPATQITSRYIGVSERIGARDLSANFRWRGNVLESVVVYTASAVLAGLTNGLLYSPQKNRFSTAREAIALARRLIAATELD